MVMSHENHVKPWYVFSHFGRFIFNGIVQTVSFRSRMEQTNQNVRMFLFLDFLYPFFRTSPHAFKTQPAPQLFGQPGRYGRSNHAEDGNLHPVPFHHLIRLQIRTTCLNIDNVGTQHRKLTLFHPTVVHGVPSFHIVVTHVAHIVTHIVQHGGAYMHRGSIHIIIVIGHRLSLKNITVIHQDDILPVLFPLLLHVGRHTSQAALHLFILNKIIRKITTMHITGFQKFQCHGLTVGCTQLQVTHAPQSDQANNKIDWSSLHFI